MTEIMKLEDVDPTETREWIESIDSVLKTHGAERAHFLLEQLIDYTRRSGAYLPFTSEHRLRQHDLAGPGAVVPRQPRDRAAHRGLHPLECAGDGASSDQQGVERIRRPPRRPTHRRPRCTKWASTISGARRRTSIPATWCSSRATRRPASTRAPSSKAASPRTSCSTSARKSSGDGLSSYPHPWLMPDFWQFPTVSMGLGPDDGDLPGALHALPGEPRHGAAVRSQGLGVPRRRRDGRAGVAWARSRCRCARSSTT